MIKKNYFSHDNLLKHEIHDREWRDRYYVMVNGKFKEIRKYQYQHYTFIGNYFKKEVLLDLIESELNV